MTESSNPYQSPQSTGGDLETSRGRRAPLRRFTSIRSLGSFVTVLFGLSVLLSVGVILAMIPQRAFIAGARAGTPYTVEDGERVDQPVNTLGQLQRGLALVLVPTFLTWFYRAYRNLPSLGLKKPEHTPGWAVGGWFVPILFWVWPYTIAKEIWNSSYPRGVDERKAKPAGTIVLAWWIVWVMAQVLVMFLTQLVDPRNPTLDQLVGQVQMAMVIEALRIVAAALVAYIVLTVSRWQDERSDRLAELAEQQPPPEPQDWPLGGMIAE